MTIEPARGEGQVSPSGAIAWLSVLIAAAILLALTHYSSRDPDSTVYAEISSRLAALPFSSWIAPDWGGSWGFTGPFREHPIGIFLLPALLGRLGYPAGQAAFVVGAASSLASLWLIGRVATPVMQAYEAVALQWAALILPIAFVYRIRSNQEYPLLALILLGLYATHRARRSAGWILVMAGAACGAALVKGVFVIFLPVLSGLWLWLIADGSATDHADRPGPPAGAAWVGVAGMIVAVAAMTWAYEWTYQRATGDSFLSFYLHNRIADNAGLARSFSLPTKLYNAVWYVARIVWFAVPGSLILLWSTRRVSSASPRNQRAVLFVALAAAAYVGAMSLGANKADRFIFPSYFLVGLGGALVAIRSWPAINRVARRLAALPPFALPVAWLLLFILTLATETRLPYVKLWTS